jgi:hypothetical protein
VQHRCTSVQENAAMSRRFYPAAAILGAVILAVPAVAQAAQAEPNVLEIVVANGPLAGTYTPPAAEVICLHARRQKRYSAAWKDFSPKGAKALAEAGINVANPDDAGAKQGEVRIAFGDAASKPIVYTVDAAPLSMTARGKGMDIAFEGKSRDGIGLRVRASCRDVEQL